MADQKAASWAVPKDASTADPSVDRLVDQRAALLVLQLVVHLAALWVVQRADQWESLRAALKVVQMADWTAAVMEINEDTDVERGQISVWWLVMCNASDVMGYGRRRPELSNAPLLVTQYTTSKET